MGCPHGVNVRVSRNFSLNGIGRRPTSLLLDDVAESGAGGKVCAIDCVRLAPVRQVRCRRRRDARRRALRALPLACDRDDGTAERIRRVSPRGALRRASSCGLGAARHRFGSSLVRPSFPPERRTRRARVRASARALGRAPDLDGGHEEGHRRARAERPPGRADSGRRARTNASGAGRRDSARRPGRGGHRRTFRSLERRQPPNRPSRSVRAPRAQTGPSPRGQLLRSRGTAPRAPPRRRSPETPSAISATA